VGTARIDKTRCIAWEQDKKCLICDEICPYNAIVSQFVTGHPITVPVIGETVPEANETFFVNLSGATNATLADLLERSNALVEEILKQQGVVMARLGEASKRTDFGDEIAATLHSEREKFAGVKRQLGFTYDGIEAEFPGITPLAEGAEINERTRAEFFSDFVLILRLRFPSDMEGRAFKVVDASPDSVKGYMRNLGSTNTFAPALTNINPDQIVGFSIAEV
jgi:ferredoxin